MFSIFAVICLKARGCMGVQCEELSSELFVFWKNPPSTSLVHLLRFRSRPPLASSVQTIIGYVREYPNKIWSYMVQYLHFRILKFPLKQAGDGSILRMGWWSMMIPIDQSMFQWKLSAYRWAPFFGPGFLPSCWTLGIGAVSSLVLGCPNMPCGFWRYPSLISPFWLYIHVCWT